MFYIGNKFRGFFWFPSCREAGRETGIAATVCVSGTCLGASVGTHNSFPFLPLLCSRSAWARRVSHPTPAVPGQPRFRRGPLVSPGFGGAPWPGIRLRFQFSGICFVPLVGIPPWSSEAPKPAEAEVARMERESAVSGLLGVVTGTAPIAPPDSRPVCSGFGEKNAVGWSLTQSKHGIL